MWMYGHLIYDGNIFCVLRNCVSDVSAVQQHICQSVDITHAEFVVTSQILVWGWCPLGLHA